MQVFVLCEAGPAPPEGIGAKAFRKASDIHDNCTPKVIRYDKSPCSFLQLCASARVQEANVAIAALHIAVCNWDQGGMLMPQANIKYELLQQLVSSTFGVKVNGAIGGDSGGPPKKLTGRMFDAAVGSY